jgi:hypothetical protein
LREATQTEHRARADFYNPALFIDDYVQPQIGRQRLCRMASRWRAVIVVSWRNLKTATGLSQFGAEVLFPLYRARPLRFSPKP